MKHVLILLAVVLIVALPVWAQEQETLVIGVVMPPQTVYEGYDALLHGAELAVRLLNEAGGVEDESGTTYRFRVLTEEAANIDASTKAAEQLMVDGAHVVIGFPMNGIIPSILPEDGAPLLVMSSGADGALWGVSPAVMGVRASDATLADAAIRFALDELDAETLVTVVARADYGYAAENGARDALTDEEADLILALHHDPQSLDFSSIAVQIADEDPDTVIVWNSTPALQNLLTALEAENWRGNIVYGYADDALEVRVPSDINLYAVTPWAINDNDDDFVDLYTDEYGESPSLDSALAYDAVNLIAAAVESTGGERDDLITWLTDDADYVGVQGTYTPRNEQGELIRAAMVVEFTAEGVQEIVRYNLNENERTVFDDDTNDSSDSGNDEDVRVRNGSSVLNLRAQPNTESAVLLVIPADSEFTAFARNDATDNQTWIAVEYEGQQGWVIEGALIVDEGTLNNLPTSSQTFTLDS